MLVAGIDAGGTKLAAGVVDLCTGQVSHRTEIRTPSTANAILIACLTLVTDLAASTPLAGIGIGVPEIVTAAGEIHSAANWDWRAVDVVAELSRVAPTRVESDVRAAALAEARFGVGVGLGCFVYLTIGTGISAVIVKDGRPLAGRCGAALIVGSPPVELIASGRALATEARLPGAEHVISETRHIELVTKAATALGREMASVVNLVDPDAIVVGGGLGLNDQYRALWVGAMRDLVSHRPSANVPVVRAGLAADAGIIGAALAHLT